MLIGDSAGCCGLKELFGLSHANADIITYKLDHLCTPGLVFATLNELQWVAEEPTLLKVGFELITEFFNPSSGRKVRFYLKKTNQRVQDKKTVL